MLRGTVAYDVARQTEGRKEIRIGHPSGVFGVGIEIEDDKVSNVTVTRTARKIMKGFVYVRE